MAAIPPNALMSMSPSSESGEMISTFVLNSSAFMKKSSMRSSSLTTCALALHSGHWILASASATVRSWVWPEGHWMVTLRLSRASDSRSMSTAPMSRAFLTMASP